VRIGLADPYGAALYSYYTTGELKSEGGSISEGIGQGRITANLEGLQVDRAYRVADDEWLPVLYETIQKEGLCLGTSSALNIVGAMKLARDLGPGKTVVTVLADYGNRYASKIFNPAFLKEKGLPTPPWMAA
jgi:cysteine synthase A